MPIAQDLSCRGAARRGGGAHRLQRQYRPPQGGQYRVFQYDKMGRLTSADNPETAPSALTSCTPPGGGRATMLYTYDNARNLLTRKDTALSTITYTPDALNRVVSKASSDGTVSFTFDQSFGGFARLV